MFDVDWQAWIDNLLRPLTSNNKPNNVEVGSRPYTKHITIVGGYTCQFIITFQDFFPQWLWQSQYRRSALEKYFQTINWEKTRWTVS